RAGRVRRSCQPLWQGCHRPDGASHARRAGGNHRTVAGHLRAARLEPQRDGEDVACAGRRPAALRLSGARCRCRHVPGPQLHASLCRGGRENEDRSRFLVRYGLKAPRKAIELAETFLFPDPWSSWDLQKFSSPGFISIDKARRLLAFEPRISVAEGMRGTEEWLRDQNFLLPVTG